jgi:hypothetical protein
MHMKITEREGKKIVAACDSGLIGQVFEEGDTILDLKTYASFYRGENANAGELEKALGEFDSANLVGKKAVGVAVGKGLAAEGDVKYIKNIPHLQIYRI